MEWKALPEARDEEDIKEYTRITHGGTLLLEIAISIKDHETGATRFGSNNGVEASARRNGDRIYLQIGRFYAEIPGGTTAEEIITALMSRLAEIIPGGKWGVEMRQFTIKAPKDVFAFVD